MKQNKKIKQAIENFVRYYNAIYKEEYKVFDYEIAYEIKGMFFSEVLINTLKEKFGMYYDYMYYFTYSDSQCIALIIHDITPKVKK